MFVLKLPRFFTRLYGDYTVEKRAVFTRLTYIWTSSSRSYIVFALKEGGQIANSYTL